MDETIFFSLSEEITRRIYLTAGEFYKRNKPDTLVERNLVERRNLSVVYGIHHAHIGRRIGSSLEDDYLHPVKHNGRAS